MAEAPFKPGYYPVNAIVTYNGGRYQKKKAGTVTAAPKNGAVWRYLGPVSVPQPSPAPTPAPQPVAGAPLLSIGTKNAEKDCNIVICGRLQGVTKVEVWTEGLSAPMPCKIAENSGQIMTVTLPETLPLGVYRIRAFNAAGASNTLLVNNPELWWAQTRVVAGETAYVYGENLHAADITLHYLRSGTGSLSVVITDINSYRITYTVPKEVVPGTEYKISVYRALTNDISSNTLTVKADAAVIYNGPVRAFDEFKQASDVSDSEAWARAFKAMNNTKGTLQMPSRAIKLHITPETPGGTNFRVVGADPKLCRVEAIEGFSGRFLFYAVFPINKVHISGVGFYGNKRVSERGMWAQRMQSCTWDNCIFDFQGLNPWDFNDSYDCRFLNCTFIGMNNFGGKSRQIWIDNCTVYPTNDAGEPFHFFAPDGISVTNTICRDYDNSKPDGWGKGRFFVCNSTWGSARNQYLSKNRTIDCEVRRGVWDAALNKHVGGPDPNSSEQNLWEATIAAADGKGLNPADNYLSFELDNLNKTMGHALVWIIGGTGQGQWKKVIKQEGKRITVDSPWTDTPDETSHFVTGHFTYNIAVYECIFDGKAHDKDFVTAGTSVSLYGGAVNCVVDNITATDLRYGIANGTMHHQDAVHDSHPGREPNMWLTFKNIKVVNAAYPLRQDVRTPKTGAIRETAAMIGITFRNFNSGVSRAKTQYLVGDMTIPNQCRHMVIEHCTFDKLPLEQQSKAGFSNSVYHKNK